MSIDTWLLWLLTFAVLAMCTETTSLAKEMVTFPTIHNNFSFHVIPYAVILETVIGGHLHTLTYIMRFLLTTSQSQFPIKKCLCETIFASFFLSNSLTNLSVKQSLHYFYYSETIIHLILRSLFYCPS